MIPARRRRRLNGPGLGTRSLFLSFSFFCFPFCSSSPMCAYMPGMGLGGSPSVPRSLSFLLSSPMSFLLPSFLGVGACRPCGGRSRFRIINKYTFTFLPSGTMSKVHGSHSRQILSHPEQGAPEIQEGGDVR